MGIYAVDDYITRAKSFIAVGDETSLRHACLELRFCIESIVYQKLRKVGKELPPSVYRTWQPPKALKLLMSFEPRADQDMTIDVCLNSVNGAPSGEWMRIGEYKMFSVKWLSKSYNKLGKLLHLTSLLETESPPEITALAVQEIVEEIERVSSADMVMTINSITVFTCDLCGSDMYASTAQIETGAVVECYKDSCGAKHNVTTIDADHFRIDRIGLFSAPCHDCGRPMPLESIHHEDEKACSSCGRLHVFRWSYAALPVTLQTEE